MQHRTLPLFAILAFTLMAAGCQIAPAHKELQPPATVAQGTVVTAETATGMPKGRVGFARITLFAIPVGPVMVQGPADRLTMDFVRDALKVSGYDATLKPLGSAVAGPVLYANIEQYKFTNYTWLAPLMPHWGRIEITAKLTAADGSVLWSKKYLGKGTSFNVSEGFSRAAEKAMTRILDQMVVDFSSPAFANALAGKPAS
jgi:hypothetical protein